MVTPVPDWDPQKCPSKSSPLGIWPWLYEGVGSRIRTGESLAADYASNSVTTARRLPALLDIRTKQHVARMINCHGIRSNLVKTSRTKRIDVWERHTNSDVIATGTDRVAGRHRK